MNVVLVSIYTQEYHVARLTWPQLITTELTIYVSRPHVTLSSSLRVQMDRPLIVISLEERLCFDGFDNRHSLFRAMKMVDSRQPPTKEDDVRGTFSTEEEPQ